jgi:histidyl-tRNA synthetase
MAAIGQLAGLIGAHEAGAAAVANLREIVALSESTEAAGRIQVDPSLARGLSYYTGAIMEIVVPDLPGSVAGGGRYDNLIGMFLGRDIPACGFALGFERIVLVMTEREMFPAAVAGAAADVMVTLWSADRRADAFALATELRAAGLRVEVYPEADRLGKQFKYASGRRLPFVAIVGDDERARGQVSIKDLRTGDQQTLMRGEIAPYLAARRS